jgi:3-methyladenine DNA glycosylase AlkD
VEPDDRVEALARALQAQADPERAVTMAAYMKDQFAFYGVQADRRRAVQRSVFARWSPGADELMAVAAACWARDERELQYGACDLLRHHVGRLGARHLPAVGRLIATKSWWDTVDALAAHVVGPLVAVHPDLEAELDRWLTSGDLWLERAAILHQLGYGDSTDEDRLFRACLAHASSTEFFHRKAIGWALRQYARVAPAAVAAFVAAHDEELSALSKREATRHLR